MITLEQQKANRKLWVEALRSGKYEQAKGYLLSENGGYCCLGVLASCAGVSDDILWGKQSLAGFFKAKEFVGLKGNLGGFDEGTDGTLLADLNDDGMPFSKIADIIEKEPSGLFVDYRAEA